MLSIILPTRKRHEILRNALANINSSTDCQYEVIIITDSDDEESKIISENFRFDPPNKKIILVADPTNYSIQKWNIGAISATGQWLFIASDDIILPPNWLSLAYATPNTGFIGLPDQKNPKGERFTPFYMATRDWLKRYNGGVLVCPHYRSWCCDVEICIRAQKVSQYSVADIIIQHNHLVWGLANEDETYKRGKSCWENDLNKLNERYMAGFPNDFQGYL